MVYPHVMLKRYICSTIIFAVLAIPSAILIYYLFAEPGYNSPLTTICEWLVAVEEMAKLGYTFADVAYDIFFWLAVLNIWLLALTYVYIIILDTINISLHWLIKSGIFVGLIILIDQFILNLTTFPAAQDITVQGAYLITIHTTIYYLVMFHLILIVKNWLSKKHV